VSVDFGLEVIRVMEAIEQSGASGREVVLEGQTVMSSAR